jgi:chromate transport protein ChrA
MDEIDLAFQQSLPSLVRSGLKAVVIASVTAITILIFTGSFWKSTWISTIVMVLALFAGLRRYLEPICVLAFAAAVIVICSPPNFLAGLTLAIR